MATRATSNDHLQQAHGEHGGKVLYLYWYILVPLTHLLMHTVPRTRTRTVRHSRRGPPSTPVGDLFTKCNAAILRLSFVGPTDRLRRGPRGRAGGSAGRSVAASIGPWRRVSVRCRCSVWSVLGPWSVRGGAGRSGMKSDFGRSGGQEVEGSGGRGVGRFGGNIVGPGMRRRRRRRRAKMYSTRRCLLKTCRAIQ
jgi:hypothetical protein